MQEEKHPMSEMVSGSLICDVSMGRGLYMANSPYALTVKRLLGILRHTGAYAPVDTRIRLHAEEDSP